MKATTGCVVAMLAASCAVVLSAASATAQTGPLRTLADVSRRLYACWEPPLRADPRTNVTVIVSFKRDGTILGQPKITYEWQGANETDRLLFRFAIMGALERCTPLSFSEGLAEAVAGRPFALRLGNRRIVPKAKREAHG